MLMRQAAFSGGHPFLKGALHCHTTRSDGDLSPEESVRLYHRLGYDFMALTDHRRYTMMPYAPDVPMTFLPGIEVDRNVRNRQGIHCFHAVGIGPWTGNGFAHEDPFPSAEIDDFRGFQPVLDALQAKNNLAIYCHPEWSATPLSEFEGLTGYFAMELWNSGCAMEDDLDTDNGILWDHLLLSGRKIFGVATDDGHHAPQFGNGWVMVNAANDVDAILAALKTGAFYASCGPIIHDFTVEDGIARISCSPASRIKFRFAQKPGPDVLAADGLLTEASCKVSDQCTYLRAVITDALGRKAWTNPIFF